MGDSIDIVIGAFSDALKMWEKKRKGFFVDLAKISILEWVVFIVPMVLIISLAMIMLGSINFDEPATAAALFGNMAFMVIAFVLIVVTYFVSMAFGSVALNAVNNRADGKEIVIMEHFRANFVPYTLYSILTGLIVIVLLLPIVLGLVLAGPGDDSGYGLRLLGNLCLFGFITVALYILFVFFIQFSKFELIIKRAGVVESLKQSYRLVRKNIVAVFVFDIVYVVIALIVGSLVSVIQRIFIFSAEIFVIAGNFAGAVFLGLLYLLITFVTTVLTSFILLPIFYFFWKRLKFPKAEPKKKKAG